MPDMLQVVEHRHLRTPGENGRGEAGIEHHVQPVADRHQRQRQLFPQDPRGPRHGANGLLQGDEIRLRGREIGPGFAIREDEVPV